MMNNDDKTEDLLTLNGFIAFVMEQDDDRPVIHDEGWWGCAVGYYYRSEGIYISSQQTDIPFLKDGHKLHEFLSSPENYNIDYRTKYCEDTYKGIKDFIKDNCTGDK